MVALNSKPKLEKNSFMLNTHAVIPLITLTFVYLLSFFQTSFPIPIPENTPWYVVIGVGFFYINRNVIPSMLKYFAERDAKAHEREMEKLEKRQEFELKQRQLDNDTEAERSKSLSANLNNIYNMLRFMSIAMMNQGSGKEVSAELIAQMSGVDLKDLE